MSNNIEVEFKCLGEYATAETNACGSMLRVTLAQVEIIEQTGDCFSFPNDPLVTGAAKDSMIAKHLRQTAETEILIYIMDAHAKRWE